MTARYRRIYVEEGEQLLPGIPDAVTLAHVGTKLPWTAFYNLSSVSRVWQRAIQSREVYDARIRSQSAKLETLVAIDHQADKIKWGGKYLHLNTISLFSVKDNSRYHLPRIPGQIPFSCQCVSLDGKLYVLGIQVYVLDLAGQRQWKQCASMKYPRENFVCGAVGGKIYVLRGNGETISVGESEVYNPKKNTWSPIKPCRNSIDFYSTVTAVGEVLFVHTRLSLYMEGACIIGIYQPITDEWRYVDHFTHLSGALGETQMLVIAGKFHRMHQHGLEVYDVAEKSWTFLQRIAFNSDNKQIIPHVAVPVDGELLAIGWLPYMQSRGLGHTNKYSLLKSRGLGCKNKEIVWQEVQSSVPLHHGFYHDMCSIQL